MRASKGVFMEENQTVTAGLMEMDVQMDASVLYDYMLYHNYHGVQGLMGTLIGLFMIIYYVNQHANIIYLMVGIVVIFYVPVSLYLSAKRQALENEFYKQPLHYSFEEEGIRVSQKEETSFLAWDDIYKAVATARSIILYTGPRSAAIIPRAACEGRTADLIRIISTHMPPKKVKIRQ